MVTGTLLVYYLAYKMAEAYAQTMCFSVFIVFQLFNVMNCRSNEHSVFKLGLFSNRAIYSRSILLNHTIAISSPRCCYSHSIYLL